MHGAGTFFDARFNDTDQYPIAAKRGAGNTRGTPDKLTPQLAALHFYQLSIPAPKAPAGSYNRPAFERKGNLQRPRQVRDLSRPASLHGAGEQLACTGRDWRRLVPGGPLTDAHVPHGAFGGLWTHQNGGFYHDGRFATLLDVVDHYNAHFNLNLSDQDKKDLMEYLKGI